MSHDQTDFLGELKHMNPERLINPSKEDEVGNFFLVLGIFYNDLKSLTFHLVRTDYRFQETDTKQVSIEMGEYGGIKSHLERLVAATLHEFFQFLDQNKAVLETSEFYLLHDKLNRDLKNKWSTIIEIASGENPSGKSNFFSKILLLIRNNLAFHYSQSSKTLRKGFMDHFYNDPKNLTNEVAYFSIGEAMRDTRFYYCDAAAKRSVQSQMTGKMELEEYTRELKDVIDDVNFTIMALMKEYLRQRPH